jgi:hypothetical protein
MGRLLRLERLVWDLFTSSLESGWFEAYARLLRFDTIPYTL